VVVGVVGGGGNAVDRLVEAGARGVECVTVNTDAQVLLRSAAPTRVRIGDRAARGLGAGGDPAVGRAAAEESREELAELLAGADLVFVAAGMGGGTGSGAAPVVAGIARGLGALTVGVVTRPFAFEGGRRHRHAGEGIAALRERADTLITIPNDRLLALADRRLPLVDAFRLADEVLRQGIQGIAELITTPGLINLDFADVRTVMAGAGPALLAIGHGAGEARATEAARAAIASPLLEGGMAGATGILFNITGGADLTLHEVNAAAGIITAAADPQAQVIFGTALDPHSGDAVRITVIATGFAPPPPFPPPPHRGGGRPGRA
jgi:cell division protein FtsZ